MVLEKTPPFDPSIISNIPATPLSSERRLALLLEGVAMANTIPGALCFFKIGDTRWPAVVIEEDMVPGMEKAKRPKGFNFPIFVIGDDSIHFVSQSEITSAATVDLVEYGHEANKADNELLQKACEDAIYWDDLKHWQTYIKDLYLAQSLQFEENEKDDKYDKFVEELTYKEKEEKCDRRLAEGADNTYFTNSPEKRRKRTRGVYEDLDDAATGRLLGKKVRANHLQLPSPPLSNDTDEPLSVRKHHSQIPHDGHSACKQPNTNAQRLQLVPIRPSSPIPEHPELDFSPGSKWSAEEDAALIRLRERAMIKNWDHVATRFKTKFPNTTRSSAGMRSRYNCHLCPNAKDSIGAGTDYKEMRNRAMAFLLGVEDDSFPTFEEDVLQSSESSSTRWTVEEDAELLRIREHMQVTNWDEAVAMFKAMFPNTTRSGQSISSRWHKYIAPDADRSGSDEMRNRALAFLLPDTDESNANLNWSRSPTPEHPGLGMGSGTKWTIEEDAELLSLRERIVKRPEWGIIGSMFKKNFTKTARSTNALSSRYNNNISAKAGDNLKAGSDYDEVRAKALAFLSNPARESRSHSEMPSYSPKDLVGGRMWTAAEDAEMVRLRERVVKKPAWDTIHHLFRMAFPQTQRTANAIKHRYSNCLATDAEQRLKGAIDCQELRDRALAYLLQHEEDQSEIDASYEAQVLEPLDTHVLPSQRWTAEEDVELIRLRERVDTPATWPQIEFALEEKSGSTRRSASGISKRYSYYLAPDASGTIDTAVGATKKCRARALAYLDRTPSPENTEEQNYVTISSGTEVEEEDAEGEDEGDVSEIESDDGGFFLTRNQEIEANAVTIIVGKEHQLFKVSIESISGNHYFIDDAIAHAEHGTLITGSRWTDINPERFQPIWQWMRYGDYVPRLKEGHLSGIKDPEDERREVVRCGHIFVLACQLRLWELIILVAKKFSMLNKRPLETLMVARLVYGQPVGQGSDSGQKEMRSLIVNELVGKYWAFVETEGRNLRTTMKKLPELHVEVARGVLEWAEKRAESKGEHKAMEATEATEATEAKDAEEAKA